MDNREKLLDLMVEAKKHDPGTAPWSEWLVDYLIANGVTVSGEIEELRADNERLREMWAKAVSDLSKTKVQRWIPVTERLPERTLPPKDVLVHHDLGCGMFVDRAWYSYDKKRWCSVLGMKLKVTHWMPLPEPPKEDE